MNNERRISPHETFELHEIINFKSVCATKSAAMSALVKDEELKELLNNDLAQAQEDIKELQALLRCSQFNTMETSTTH